MKCFHVQVDPDIIKSPLTQAYLYAANAEKAKSWAGKRWNVSEKLIQAEMIASSQNLPTSAKPITVPVESRQKVKSSRRKEPKQEAKQA